MEILSNIVKSTSHGMIRWLFFFVLLTAVGCVPNRKYVYLQKNDVNAKALKTDSVQRVYNTVSFDYKVQPQDILSIRFESISPKEHNFFSSGSLQQNQTFQQGGPGALLIGELVDAEGNVPFPVVGKVKVSGLNVFEIQEKLQQIANQYLESPTVKVRLLNYRITLLGEVNKEGVQFLSNNRVSIMEAIGISGGLTDLADKSNVKLIREIDGKTQVLYINLLKEDFINSPFYYVHQNDILIVPPLRQRPFRKYFNQNFSLILSVVSIGLVIYNLSN